jgi:hypothetical protein
MENYPQQNYQMPTYSLPPQKKSKKWLYVLLVLLLVALVGGGVWYMRQTKVDSLEKKVADLEKQLDDEKKKNDEYESLFSPFESSDEPESDDTIRETDIKSIHGQVEAYYAQNGRYPTFANINDSAWRSVNMKGFDSENLKDPDGTEAKLVAVPAKGVYAYEVTPEGCDNSSTDCSGYTLTATLDKGGTYVKSALN